MSWREPAQERSALSLQEMQLLSKDVTYRFFEHSADKEQLARFALSADEKADLPRVTEKLFQILHHPVVVNNVQAPPEYAVHSLDNGKTPRHEVRVTSWNIEEGRELEKIIPFFTGAPGGKCDRARARELFPWAKNAEGKTILDEKGERALDEVCALNETDILMLNEVDDGMCRSGYRPVASDLANALNMNYVFAPSFYEAEPAKSGLMPAENQFCKQENLEATKNLTGNALLSRYPIENVKVVALPVGYLKKDGKPATKDDHDTYCYDWHDDEINGPTLVDQGIRAGVKILFNEEIGRELRFGSRNAIVADVQLPSGAVTIVAAHLENKAKPSCRQAQMRYLLSRIQTTHPLVIAGDMNTTGEDGGHRSVKRTLWELAIGQTVESEGFWQNLFNIDIPNLSLGTTVGKKVFSQLTLTQNPTRVDLKWLRPNPEGHLFSFMKEQGFAFKGGEDLSISGKDEGPWSSTNARDKMGFQGTHFLKKTYGTLGISKLDWFFVKSNGDQCATPRLPRTLELLRDGYGQSEFPSDHVPITLMLGAPCPGKRAAGQ